MGYIFIDQTMLLYTYYIIYIKSNKSKFNEKQIVTINILCSDRIYIITLDVVMSYCKYAINEITKYIIACIIFS